MIGVFLSVLYLVSFCGLSESIGVEEFVPQRLRYSRGVSERYSLLASSSFFSTSKYHFNNDSTLPILYPTDFGADPTGKTDSTTAFSAVVKALLAKDTGHKLADGITDLGGATVDLAGGDYLISQPIVIPVYYGNFHFKSGTLRASSAFPKDRFLIEIGSKSCSNGQGSCNENVGFEDMMLDSQLIAAGGLYIIATMGANVGPQMFFLGFQNAGIRVSGGHETMIHETWLGQYLYSDPRSSNPTANGIELLGNDHYITNTIVFSSRVGVLITGAANLLTGVHTWNLASSEGGIGIYVDAPGYTQNRLVACYLDFNSVVAVAPEHLSIVDGFFLCGGNIVLVAIPGHQTVNGLNVIDNQWDQCSNNTIMLDQTQAKFTDVIDTTIESNMANPTSLLMKSTKATAKLRLENASKWQFDFNNRLLFGSIQNFGYSMVIEGNGFARHAARAINGNIVTVETDQPVTGTVYVWVDQSRDSQPCGSTCK